MVDATVTPFFRRTDPFGNDPKAEAVFGQLNCLFFILGFIMNGLVAYTIKKRGIKTPVDVCTLLISASNWLTVLLDLFIGISYIHNGKAMAFSSLEFSQFWGFLKVTNHEWLAALLALLVLSNLLNRSKLFIFLMAVSWLIIECILLSIPLGIGVQFQVFSILPHPIPDHSNLLRGWGMKGYMAWTVIVEVLPYMYFYLLTGAGMLSNAILYSNIKQGLVEASPKKVQDTLTVISYAIFYLITDSPEVFITLLWGMFKTILSEDCADLKPIFIKMFHTSLFINTIRAAAYPLVFFYSKYGNDIFIIPVKKVTNLLGAQTRYRRFHGEDQLRYGDIEDVELEVEQRGGDV